MDSIYILGIVGLISGLLCTCGFHFSRRNEFNEKYNRIINNPKGDFVEKYTFSVPKDVLTSVSYLRAAKPNEPILTQLHPEKEEYIYKNNIPFRTNINDDFIGKQHHIPSSLNKILSNPIIQTKGCPVVICPFSYSTAIGLDIGNGWWIDISDDQNMIDKTPLNIQQGKNLYLITTSHVVGSHYANCWPISWYHNITYYVQYGFLDFSEYRKEWDILQTEAQISLQYPSIPLKLIYRDHHRDFAILQIANPSFFTSYIRTLYEQNAVIDLSKIATSNFDHKRALILSTVLSISEASDLVVGFGRQSSWCGQHATEIYANCMSEEINNFYDHNRRNYSGPMVIGTSVVIPITNLKTWNPTLCEILFDVIKASLNMIFYLLTFYWIYVYIYGKKPGLCYCCPCNSCYGSSYYCGQSNLHNGISGAPCYVKNYLIGISKGERGLKCASPSELTLCVKSNDIINALQKIS